MLIYSLLKQCTPEARSLYCVAPDPHGRAAQPLMSWTQLYAPTEFERDRRVLEGFADQLWVRQDVSEDHQKAVRLHHEGRYGVMGTYFVLYAVAFPMLAITTATLPAYAAIIIIAVIQCVILAVALDRTFWAMRRLHDIGTSGFWALAPNVSAAALTLTFYWVLNSQEPWRGYALLAAIALHGGSVGFMWLFLRLKKGQSGPNRYGPEPAPLPYPYHP